MQGKIAKGVISQKECRAVLDHALNTTYRSLISVPVRIRFIKRLRSSKSEQKNGIQNMMKINEGLLKSAEITITNPERKNIERLFFSIYHELYHVYQVESLQLSFEGNTFIYLGRRYPLNHRVYPDLKKGEYTRYKENYLPPWESFATFVKNISSHEAMKWVSK